MDSKNYGSEGRRREASNHYKLQAKVQETLPYKILWI